MSEYILSSLKASAWFSEAPLTLLIISQGVKDPLLLYFNGVQYAVELRLFYKPSKGFRPALDGSAFNFSWQLNSFIYPKYFANLYFFRFFSSNISTMYVFFSGLCRQLKWKGIRLSFSNILFSIRAPIWVWNFYDLCVNLSYFRSSLYLRTSPKFD